MSDQKLENVSLEEGSSNSNEKSNNNDQLLALNVSSDDKREDNSKKTKEHKFKSFINFMLFRVRWFMVFYHTFLLMAFLYGAVRSSYIFLVYPLTDEWIRVLLTWTFTFFLTSLAGIGLSAGAHRLWSHHAFKARLFLRILLALLYTLAAEGSIMSFVHYHRLHHKYIDTYADPQNIKRGMFYAQIGWRLQQKHPEYKRRIKEISYDDVHKDKVVMFHQKYYLILVLVVGYIIPVAIPMYLWEETFINSLCACGAAKSFLAIHMHGMVGSVCHTFGQRTYNARISATDNPFMQYFVVGEAYHNFHHTFPYDYAICELGKTFNFSKWFIDACAYLKLASNLRTVGIEYVNKAKDNVNAHNPSCYDFD